MNLDKFKGVFCALNAIYDENDNRSRCALRASLQK